VRAAKPAAATTDLYLSLRVAMMITTQLTPRALPDGYSFDPEGVSTRDTIPGQALYGGADISGTSDAAGLFHMACCSRGPDGDFRFRVFRYIGATATDLPLQHRCTGRGEISVDHSTGKLCWIAWEGSQFFTADVPGAAPFPPALSASAYVPIQPNAYSAGVDGQAVSGGRSLSVAALYAGVPAHCRAYNVRLVVQAASADTRARLGTEQQPGQLTANTQQPNLQVHTVGIVNAGPGGSLWLSIAPEGRSANVWLTVAGYWPG
jgi:hypothetical protein